MEKKFERIKTEKPLGNLGKPPKKNKRPNLNSETINEKKDSSRR